MKLKTSALIMAAAATLLWSPAAWAQPEDLVDRLDEAMRRPHVAADTALVFTNLGNAATKVSMVAYTSEGRRAASRELEVPGNGVRLVLASDLVGALTPPRFIGKVIARGTGRLASSAVLFGGPLTDLRTIDQTGRTAPTPTTPSQAFTVMTFPLVATY